MGSRDAIGGQVNRPSTGKVSTVGERTPTTRCVCEGDWIRGERHKETAVVKTGDGRAGSVEHAGRGITGSPTEKLGQGRGIRRPGKKVQVTDRQH